MCLKKKYYLCNVGIEFKKNLFLFFCVNSYNILVAVETRPGPEVDNTAPTHLKKKRLKYGPCIFCNIG